MPTFDIQIENGQLLLAPLKDTLRTNKFLGPRRTNLVPATIENIVKYLRVIDPNLSVSSRRTPATS